MLHGDNVDKNNLAIQLAILAVDHPQGRITVIMDYFMSLSPAKKHLMSRVHCTD